LWARTLLIVLGIDTATADAAVAITAGGDLLADDSVGPGPDGRPRHSQALLPEIERLVGKVGGWDAIERIAVGVGPGSYTGLRIGISTARAVAQGRELPIAGVSSLEALARGIAAASRPDDGREPFLPLIDARRGQVFAALYDRAGDELWEPFVAAPDELAARVGELDQTPLGAGDGALRFATELEAAGVAVVPPGDVAHRISARHVCGLGETGTAASPDSIEPIYLRAPDAKRWLDRDRGSPPG
jgi:tRNA threonylcarbamoyladenosine biosynthesis protein TsaB